MKFYEKLLISLIGFILVIVATIGIVAYYAHIKNNSEEHKKNSVVLDYINLF